MGNERERGIRLTIHFGLKKGVNMRVIDPDGEDKVKSKFIRENSKLYLSLINLRCLLVAPEVTLKSHWAM